MTMILSMFLAVLALPAGLSYFEFGSSTTPGTMIVATLAILLCYIRRPSCNIKINSRISFNFYATLVLLGITIQFLIASLFGQIDLLRSLASIVPLGLLVWGAGAMAQLISSSGPIAVDGAARALFWLMLIEALLSIVDPFQGLGRSDKSIFPFSEPSFFALAFTPFFLYMCVVNRRARILLWAFVLATALILQSLTLIVGCGIVAAICWPLRRIIVLLIPMLLVLALVTPSLELGYYTERLDFSRESENRSTLVYIQGWQLIMEAWSRTFGWGTGFQQLGIGVTGEVPAREYLQIVAGEDVNMLDGGFVAAKILAEFGIAGAFCAALYLWISSRAIIFLRAAARMPGQYNAIMLISASFIVSFLIDLFVRGSGYFTGTALLATASLYIFLGKLCSRST